jgi:hypothetical protein
VDWDELANTQLSAARSLAPSPSTARPYCSRAYYAAYSLVTHRLEPAKISFAHGWRNPAYADLPKYVAVLAGLDDTGKRAVRRALRRLRQRREDADYRPRMTIDGRTARESLRDAAEIFRILGEDHES